VKDDYSKNGQLNEFQNSFKKHPKRPRYKKEATHDRSSSKQLNIIFIFHM